MSRARRGKAIKVGADKLSVASTCGYRSAQSSRGACTGTWYFEMNVAHLGATGHCRLGVGSHKQEMEAPCGYTDASYGYRDVDGSKVHKSTREAYGAGYKEGDVVGCAPHGAHVLVATDRTLRCLAGHVTSRAFCRVWIHMPEGGRPMEPKSEIVRWRGRLYQTPLEPDEAPKPLEGSALGFCVNGAWQVRACVCGCSLLPCAIPATVQASASTARCRLSW